MSCLPVLSARCRAGLGSFCPGLASLSFLVSNALEQSLCLVPGHVLPGGSRCLGLGRFTFFFTRSIGFLCRGILSPVSGILLLNFLFEFFLEFVEFLLGLFNLLLHLPGTFIGRIAFQFFFELLPSIFHFLLCPLDFIKSVLQLLFAL